ncbi:MotE family protein [Ruegeria aquimaris]|uniref:Magnesium transporter MgtE intracellular domain-containing protein n=1 Tax=Ruegeria aquimaris TaxID=2984333 RepID=A0ABT3AFN1_9RHOB|nr:hypothetical protein [Ruegeria sp. XHP0148]MCV2887487.1 hypothetical protein [Ruegeria sp. XHP0148]
MSTATKPAAAARVRGGALLLISLLMIGSAAIRIVLEAGPAFARGSEPEQAAQAKPEKSGQAPSDPDLHQLLVTLRQREQDLDARESHVMERMRALEIAETAIDRKLAELSAAEQTLSDTLAKASVAAEGDLSRLTDVYEKMKPKDAAALFEEMDPTFAAGFLARMQPELAAAVMAGLSPKAAYTISVVLAGRNASVPKE